MKKVLTGLLVMLFAFVLIACEQPTEEPPVTDGAIAKLASAKASLATLIEDKSNVTGNFEVPTKLANNVTATWVSSETGVVSFGQPNASTGFAVATVNRPNKGDGDATATITATLSLKSEISDEMLTDTWSETLTIKEKEVADVSIESVADILALEDAAYDGTYQVVLEDMTIFAKSANEAWAYDGTGIIQIYQGAAPQLEVGKVYTISGTIDWYFGI